VEYQVKVYQTHAGKKPFDSWLNSLKDKKIQVAIDLRLERVRLGNLGQNRSLGNGVYELKIDLGPGFRIYYGKIGLQVILLLCAGDKKTQQKDIDLAKKYFQDFKVREQ
jgi:putative addiction module killer protein